MYGRTPRFLFSLLLPFTLCVFWVAQAAAETIRVAIYEKQSNLAISAPGGVLIKDVGSQTWRQYGTQVSLSVDSGGIKLNDQEFLAQRVEIRGKNKLLKVNKLWVEGSVRLTMRHGSMTVVNILDLEDYLVGVLLGEVPSAWPPEALKVQAIASRTYALHQKEKKRYLQYDVVSTTLDQVYKGASSPEASGFETAARRKVKKAIDATRGQFMAYEGRPILAAFHSTAAGVTEDALQVWSEDIPYLMGVACPWDYKSKFYDWTRAIPIVTVEKRLRRGGHRVGVIASITPMVMTRSDRVRSLRILHSKGELLIRGEDFRKALGYTALMSTQFDIVEFGREVVFQGKGAGHGVGLCQWGAKELAESGLDAHAILRYYYPGATLSILRR